MGDIAALHSICVSLLSSSGRQLRAPTLTEAGMDRPLPRAAEAIVVAGEAIAVAEEATAAAVEAMVAAGGRGRFEIGDLRFVIETCQP